MENHIIVCGLGQLGFRIVELLHTQCEAVAVVSKDTRPILRRQVDAWDVRYVEGDAREESCLREAGIETARALLICTQDDLLNVEIALDAQRLNPALPLIIRLFDRFVAERIERDLHARNILSPAALTAPVFVAAALGSEILRAFEIDGKNINIVRLPFTDESPGLGETIEAFCTRLEIIPLAVHWNRDSRRHDGEDALDEAETLADDTRLSARFNLAASAHIERTLAPGDEVVVAASGEVTERLRYGGYLPEPENSPTTTLKARRRLLQGTRKAFSRVPDLLRAWRDLPYALHRAAYALLSLFAVSVVVFHYALFHQRSWVDSFYFVVSILTTVGFGDYNLQHAPPWLKLYGCLVMIGSAGLIAILFGLITDVIVSRRVEQALGQKGLKLTNHVIVVGMGAVGAQVVQELNRLGDPVVAITREADQEAVPELSDVIPVIIGDGNRASVLQQARVDTARAVIATSTEDLRNLRIAHQAESLNPRVRSVVRIFDTALAAKLGAGLSIDTTVNVASTAAATFAACALQTHVEQAFTLGDRLFLLHWIPPEEVYRTGMTGATIEEVRGEECSVVLRRTGTGSFQQTLILEPDDVIGRGDWLLLLEEYFPHQHQSGPPELAPYADSAAL